MQLRSGKQISSNTSSSSQTYTVKTKAATGIMSAVELLTLPILPSSPPATATATCTPTKKLLSPPPEPYPWRWRCHKCRSTYRLSATRRCLECGHIFCVRVVVDQGCASPSQSSSRSHKTSKNKVTKRSSAKKERSRTCSAEFDYMGWQAWGSYRRLSSSWRFSTSATPTTPSTTSTNNYNTPDNRLSYATFFPSPIPNRSSSCSSSSNNNNNNNDNNNDKPNLNSFNSNSNSQIKKTNKKNKNKDKNDKTGGGGHYYTWDPLPRSAARSVFSQKESLYLSGRHDCSIHCDFPSECRHAIYQAWSEGRVLQPARIGGQNLWNLSDNNFNTTTTTGNNNNNKNTANKLEIVARDDDDDDNDDVLVPMEIIKEEPESEPEEEEEQQQQQKEEEKKKKKKDNENDNNDNNDNNDWTDLNAMVEKTKKLLESLGQWAAMDWTAGTGYGHSPAPAAGTK